MGTEKSEKLAAIKKQILCTEGVIGVGDLTEEDRRRMEALEDEAMKNVLGGMGKGRNDGLRIVLSRQFVMAFFVNTLFAMPLDTNMMVLMCNGEVKGKATMDPETVKAYKKDRNYFVLSDFFIISKDAKLSPASFASGESCFVFNGAQADQFLKIKEMKNHLIAIPSPPGFQYLYEKFKDEMKLTDPRIGGFLIGFDLGSG